MKIRELSVVFVSLVIWLFSAQEGKAQAVILNSSAEGRKILKNYPFKAEATDSLSAAQSLKELISRLQKGGYFTANATVLEKVDSSHWQAHIALGQQYQWTYLDPGNLDPLMQEQSGFREKLFLDRPFSHDDLGQMIEQIIKEAENKGFPFASVQLTEVKVHQEEVSASLHYESGPYITFGELQLSGTDKIKAEFLASYLKIPSGSAYSEKKVDQITQALRALPYVEMAVPLEVSFQNDEAEVRLTLTDRKVNQMDGLVNLLPNENEEGSVLLTGSLEILLNNLMRSGKQLSLQWQRLQVESQRLSISYQHPYLFRTPYQAGFSFNLLKEDTLFINRSLAFNFAYPLAQASMISVNTDFRSSSVLSNVVLPSTDTGLSGEVGDFDLLNVGLSLQLNRLNDVVLPTRGWNFEGTVGVGRKSSHSNGREANRDISWQPFSQLTLRQYYPLGKLWVLYHRLSGAYLSGENLYLNDLYRVGGLRSLRGFNDNFFYAAYYGISNLELRLLLEQAAQTQSYLYVFYDQSVLGYQLAGHYQGTPLGLGLGLSITTDVGLFNFAYAIGKVQNQPIDFSLSKIHFGYISRF
ncbi:BamA/TamA family outer membrane protein [Catalinimonas sp. 4WD22]|uniref:BamA/TamA family outer membrane protein n=1 Tax=Catalinimonas locisalis TaxID=3133978 RepID=UPI00310171B9